VINKKIGNAIKRHRMNRLLRVSFMELVQEMRIEEKHFDLEYVAFKFCDSKEALKSEFEQQLKQVFDI
jgi:ribonuclease P protein component